MTHIILVCGVPGSGKSWVCQQLTDKFTYVNRDICLKQNHLKELFKVAQSTKSIITEVPFGELELYDILTNENFTVDMVFIIEQLEILEKRYEAREGKSLGYDNIIRATKMADRVKDGDAFYGTSDEVLKYLKEL